MAEIAAEYVVEYLGTFLAHMIRTAPNSATSDNCRRAAEAMIEAAVAEERARWRKWCIEFSERPIPEILMEKAEEKPVGIRDAISLGWSAVLLGLQAELMREKRGDAPQGR